MSSIEGRDRPLRRDAERNRRRILEAAGGAFAARGLGVTMDEIAEQAGVGVGTVYRHFPAKQLLIDALLDDMLSEMVAVGQQALEEDEPWEALLRFIEHGLKAQADNRGFEDFVLSSTRGREHFRRLAPIADALVERAHQAGSLRPEIRGSDLPLLQVMFGALVDFSRDVEPETWRRIFAVVVDGLRARHGLTALPVPALELGQVERAIHHWKPARRS